MPNQPFNRFVNDDGSLNEQRLYDEANYIIAGACNPVAVSSTLAEMCQAVSRTQPGGHPTVCAHPAIRVTLDHLNVIILGANHPALDSTEGSYAAVMNYENKQEG